LPTGKKPVLLAVTLLFFSAMTSGCVTTEWQRAHTAAIHCESKHDLAGAEQHFRTALKIAEAAGADDPRVSTTKINLASAYCQDAKYAQAEALLKQTLATAERKLPPDLSNIQSSLNGLRDVYGLQNRTDEEIQVFLRTIGIHEKTLGPNHPEIPCDLSSLGAMYLWQEKYDDAESTYKRALAIDEKIYHPDDFHIANHLSNLAMVYCKQRKYAQSELLYKQAMAMYEKDSGSNQLYLATSLKEYAVLLRETNRDAEATKIESHAQAIQAAHK
jgi:tetratricopeptide (TPR) repeat protein